MKEYHRESCIFSLKDFEKSLVLLKDALYENNIDHLLIEETLSFYKTIKNDLVNED